MPHHNMRKRGSASKHRGAKKAGVRKRKRAAQHRSFEKNLKFPWAAMEKRIPITSHEFSQLSPARQCHYLKLMSFIATPEARKAVKKYIPLLKKSDT